MIMIDNAVMQYYTRLNDRSTAERNAWENDIVDQLRKGIKVRMIDHLGKIQGRMIDKLRKVIHRREIDIFFGNSGKDCSYSS